MKKLILLVILAFSMVLSPLTTTMASTPKLINYQGKLKNLPAQSGTFLVVFELFEDAAGGTALWIEQKNVTPSADGTFSTYLGETNPIDLKFDKQYYVQVTVGNNQPFPRTQLTSAPSAFYAADADTALYAFESGLAMDVAPSVLDWDNFTADAAMAGGDLMGNYPNPQIRPDAILDNIPDGSITTEMLSPNISTSPSGAAGGDMTGTYPDPLIAVGAVKTDRIADAAVTNDKLADGAVTSTKILDGEVKTADLADGSVTEVKIADDAVSTLKIRDLAVTTAKINDAAVTTVKLADDAVTSNKIADGTIQPIDLNSTGQPQGQQLTADGSGNVIWDDALGLPYSGSHDGTAIQDAFVINHSGAIDNGSVAVFTSGTSGNTEPAVEITKDVDPGAGAALAVSGIGVTGTNYIATFSNNNGVEGRTLLLTSNSPVLAAQITDPNGVPNSGDEYVTPDPTGTDLNDATLVVRNSNAAVSNQKLAIKTYGSIQANSTVQGTNLVAHGGQITLLNPTNGAVATLMPPTNVGDPLNITPAVDINGTSTVNGLNNIWESADGNLFPASTGTDRDVPTALAVSNSIGSIAAEPFITFQTDGGGLTNNRVFAVTANLTNTIGGADNSNATLDLSNTTVTAGSYGNGTGTSYSTFTVDAKGRLTAAATQAILVNDNGTADIDITGATSNNLDLQIRANAVTPAEVAPGNYDTDLTAGNYNLGNLDGTIIGAGTPATGAFTALTASSLGLTGDLDMQGNNINNVFTISNAGNAVLLADDFAVSGTVQAAGLVTAFAGATVTGSNLTVGSTTIDPGTGNTNVGGTVTAAGLVTANGGLTVVGSVSLDANEIDDAEVVNTLTIDGGQVDNTPVGAGGASTGAFTTLSASGLVSANGGLTVVGSVSLDANEIDDAEVVNTLTIDGGTVDNTPVGAGGASTGAFTTLTASSLVLTGDLDMQSNDINNVATISNAGGANVSLSDDFAVTGTTTSTGLVTASGGLTVVGSVSLDANEINDNEVVNTLTIDGGQVDNTPVGAGGASTGTFTTLSASSLGLTGDLDMQGNNIKNVATISNAGGANVSVSDDFAVTGTTTSLGIVNAFAGASVFGGNLTVGTTTIDPGTGNTNVGGTVTAAGLVTANGGATVTGSNLTVGSTTIAPGTGNTNVGGLLTQSSSTTSATAANVYFVTGNFDATTLVGFTAGSVIHIAFTDGAQYTITDANGASPSCNGGTVAYNGSNWYIVSTY
jgi:hypothetical protein